MEVKAVVFTLGCKVNEVESASIMSELEREGWEVSDRLSPADVYVLNTCAVTAEAEKKSRQLVARAKKFNPDAAIFICGCASEKNARQFENRGVAFIGGAQNKAEVVAAVARNFGGSATCGELPYPKQVKTRAFVKIQDGCNNFCSYCIIPHLRGRSRSRTVRSVVDEICATAAREVVITGINISAFGRERGESLKTLTDALAGSDKRIRLGSLECNVVDESFLASLKALKDFAPQFHLSLQSGSDAVLKAMNRHYTRGQFLEKCALIYDFFPDAAITTDIIVGFCGETEEDFLQSLRIVEEARLARVHAFAYSPREGTRAYALRDVPADVKSERLHRLLTAAAEAEKRFIRSRISARRSVIFEDFDGVYTDGYTADYVKVYAEGNYGGETRTVRLLQPFKDGALVEIVGE